MEKVSQLASTIWRYRWVVWGIGLVAGLVFLFRIFGVLPLGDSTSPLEFDAVMRGMWMFPVVALPFALVHLAALFHPDPEVRPRDSAFLRYIKITFLTVFIAYFALIAPVLYLAGLNE